MQVDPIKPTLKAPGTNRLKLEYDEQLSDFAFKFNLRCYKLVVLERAQAQRFVQGLDTFLKSQQSRLKAGAYTRSLLSST